MSKLLRKLLAVSLCAALIGGTAISLPVFVPESGITADAEYTSGNYLYEVENNEATITGYNGSGGNVTIPSKIGGYTVTSIGSYAFSGCSSLTSVTIPDSVTSIGQSAFYRCSSLTSVTIPDSVTSIGQSAFSGCSSLTSVTIPDSVTTIGGGAFSHCSSLTSVTIPDSVTSIGQSAFSGCSSLTSINVDKNNKKYSSYDGGLYDKNLTEIVYCPQGKTDVTIPNSVTSIGKDTFFWYENLTSVTIPDSVTSIGERAFYCCINLTSITIPDSVMSIENHAFFGCSSLTSVTIPDSVTSIGYGVFYGCSSLTNVTIPKSVTKIEKMTFGYYTDDNYNSVKIDNFTIYGEEGTAAEEYANDNGFKFVAQSEVQPTGITLNKTSLSLEKGKSIKLTATVSPSNATDKTVKWSTDKSYIASVDSTGLIKANSCGTATITAKTSNGKTATCKVTVYEALKNNSEVSATTVISNTAVTLTGKATGGTAPYTYAYYYKKSTDSAWTKIAGYGTATSKTFKPTSAGTYIARVNIKDSTGTLVQKDFTVTVKAALANKSTVSAENVTANTAVTLTGKATGGTSPYKFAYYYKKSTDSSWTKAYVTASGSAYTKNTSVSFKPTTAGTYTVRINTKDDSGTVVQKEFTLKVTAALKNNSTISATSVTANTAVTMTGKATGGTSPYKYAYYYKKSTDSVWTKAYVTSSGSVYTKYDSMTFTPKTAGTYNVRINVKDKYGEGNVVSKDFTVKVK